MSEYEKLYINTNPVIIRKWKNKVKNKCLINIYDEEFNKDDYIGEAKIIFPDKWIWNNENSNNKTNKLFSKHSSKYEEDIEVKDNVYNVKHINLLPYTTIEEFKFIISAILKIDYSDIFFVQAIEENDYVDEEIDKERSNNYKWFHSINEKILDYNAYETTLSIGYKKFIVDVVWKGVKLNTNYEYKFYNNHVKICEYIQQLINNYNELLNKGFEKINEDIIYNSCTIQNIEVSLLYGKDINLKNVKINDTLINEINIVKLFNLTNVSNNLKKILINDNSLTEYNNEDREIQYIKTHIDIDEPFKNTFSRFNCCSIYVVNEIYPGITLSRIEVYKNGLIKCCFMINDPDIKIDLVKDTIKTYFKRIYSEDNKTLIYKGKFWKLFNRLKIEECVYDFFYNTDNYIPVYSNISYIYNLENVKSSKFKNSFNIVEQSIPTLVYKTNTSSFLSLYSSYNINTYYSYYYSKSFHNIVTDTTIKVDVLTHGHLQAIDNETIVFYLSKCYSKEDILMNCVLLIPIFGINKKNAISKEDYNKLSPLEKEKEIRKKYKAIPTKKGIKRLMEIDPVLFGTRLINEQENRPYSALAQKREQRVVAINKEEYNILYNINPEYVIDIKNQSQGSQRLYLFCPFETFKYLNFHHYHNQLCIPKCTTAITKRTQYMYCTNQLDGKNIKDTFTGDSSKMVVYYSPLLLSGRKCYPPEELSIICENYLLYKLESTVDLLNYCKSNYGLDPFIITRDNINKQYILNTELEPNIDYILILQSELDNGYYLIIDENKKPFILSEHKELLQFFISIQTNKNTGYDFFNFIDEVFNLNISSEYKNKSFRKILNILIEEYNIKIVTNMAKTEIIAIVKTDKNMLLFTPVLSYDKNALNLQEININIAINNYGFPNINMFDRRFIKNYYQDYVDKKIHAIEYNGVNVIIEKEDIEHINTGYNPVILFDYESYFNYYLFGASKRIRENVFEKIQQNKEIEKLIYNYIFIYYNTVTNIDKRNIKEDIINILEDINIVKTNEPTKINQLMERSNIISWKNSIINKEDFMNIYNNIIDNITYLSLIDIIYNELSNNMNIFKFVNNISRISSKIITNNTI